MGQLEDTLGAVIGWRSTPCLLLDSRQSRVVRANAAAETWLSPESVKRANEKGLGLPLAGTDLDLDPAVRKLRFGEDVYYILGPSECERTGQARVSALSDIALQSIVEAHFALWYEWDVSTGSCQFPGQIDDLLGSDEGEEITCIEKWLTLVHPDDLAGVVAENEKAILACGLYRGEYRLRRSDGTYVLVSDSGVVLTNGAGAAECMIGGIRDITLERSVEQSLQESAALYHALVGCALMPVLRVGRDGLLVDANAAAASFFEVKRQELIGSPMAELLPEEMAEQVDSLLRITDRCQLSQAASETQITVGSRSKVLLSTLVPSITEGQSSVFLLGADLTERKRMSDALIESERAIREYASTVEERNTALRVMLEQRQVDREYLESAVLSNVDGLLAPLVDRLIRALNGRPEQAIAESIRMTLHEIARPLLRETTRRDGAEPRLTRRESEVLQLVKSGYTTAEIAEALHVSPTTITFHRGRIREKLGIHGSAQRLTSALVTPRSPGPPAFRKVPDA